MKPRLKTRMMPGDIPKLVKIEMLEGKHPDVKRSKTYKKILRMNERAILKEETKEEIDAESE